MTTLANIELTCPVCGTRFVSQRIASTNSVGQDTDFRPITIGLDPQPHYVHVCPRCMFAAFEGDYETAQDPVRNFVLAREHHPEELVAGGGRAALSGSTKYLLAARCYRHDTRASDLRLADLYLRASWCARQESLPEREAESQCEAIMLFEKALDASEVAEDQARTILYLLGELYRRVGRFEFAIAMFDRALESIGEDEEEGEEEDEEAGERFEDLIRRQREAAQNGHSENMTIESD